MYLINYNHNYKSKTQSRRHDRYLKFTQSVNEELFLNICREKSEIVSKERLQKIVGTLT